MSHSVYPILDLTFIAGEDLSSYQYQVVELSSTQGEVIRHQTPHVFGVGVLRNKPVKGETAAVRIFGVTEVMAATGGLTLGSAIGPAVNGSAPTSVSTNITTDGSETYGVVLESSGTALGDLATCLVDFVTHKVYTNI
jgi:hypothetical protein